MAKALTGIDCRQWLDDRRFRPVVLLGVSCRDGANDFIEVQAFQMASGYFQTLWRNIV